MERALAVPDKTKSILLISIVIMNAVRGISAGWIGDRIGVLKTLLITLTGWIICLPVIAYTDTLTILAAMTVCIGLLIGAMWATIRAYRVNCFRVIKCVLVSLSIRC